MEQQLLKIEDAAAALGISRSLTYKLIARGELQRVKIGKSARVPRAAVEAFVARQVAGIAA